MEEEKKSSMLLKVTIVLLTGVVGFIIGEITGENYAKYKAIKKLDSVSKIVEDKVGTYEQYLRDQQSKLVSNYKKEKLEYQTTEVKSAIRTVFSKMYYKDLKNLKHIDLKLIPERNKIIYALTKDGVTIDVGFFNDRDVFETTLE